MTEEGWPRSNDYFKPPITDSQMKQVQSCINDALKSQFDNMQWRLAAVLFEVYDHGTQPNAFKEAALIIERLKEWDDDAE